MYAITGASGKTGRAVAEALIAAGKDVQVIGRNEKRLQALVDLGAQAHVCTLDDAQAMTIAFSGAVGVYCITPTHLTAADFYAHQRHVGEALAAAIHKAGVEYVVNVSSIGAQHKSGTGPIKGLSEQEGRLNALKGVNVLHLRPGFFMENLLMNIDAIRKMGVVGTPARADLAMPMIATRDIGNIAADRLLALDFSGKTTRELLGPKDITLAHATRAIATAISKPDLKYVELPYDDFRKAMIDKGVGPAAAAVFTELYRGINEGLVVPTEERSPDNTTPTTIEEYSKSFALIYGAQGS